MIPLLATLICAIILAQTIWILRLQGELAEVKATWRPRHDAGPLPPMPWPAANENAVIGQHWRRQRPGDALVGEIETDEDVERTEAA